MVRLKYRKTLALLEQQLRAACVVTAQTRIIAGAKARDIHTSTLELFEKVLGPTTMQLAREESAPGLTVPSVIRTGRRAANAKLETGRYRLDDSQITRMCFLVPIGYRRALYAAFAGKPRREIVDPAAAMG